MEAQSYNGPNSLSVWCLGPPQPLNQGQGQSHRWTQSNLQTEIQSNCQTSGHAKSSQQESFHKHLSRPKEKKKGRDGETLQSHLVHMHTTGRPMSASLCRQTLYCFCSSATYIHTNEVEPLMPPSDELSTYKNHSRKQSPKICSYCCETISTQTVGSFSF